MSVVVTGATGQLGGLVIDALLRGGATPSDVVAVGRNAERLAQLAALGVQTRTADYADPASLDAALVGATRVLLISGTDFGQRAAQHANVAAAAAHAGVELLAYTSITKADTSGMMLASEHLASEQAIAASGVPFTILRHSWYIENYLGDLAGTIERGVVLGSAGTGRVSAATRADYAAAAAAVLLAPTVTPGAVHELGGAPFTLAEYAAVLQAASGKPVTYRDVPASELAAALTSAGVPEAYAGVLADSDEGIARGDLEADPATLTALIGHAPTTLAEAVATALATA